MGIIHVLDKQMAELIAAGEVVERPASVVKELVENAIDAGATQITVEIERGGILSICVRDNGCGIERGDVPTAFLRHATSKLQQKADLDAIGTLGFRGEALAAISSVSKTQLITRRAEDEVGTVYTINGGVGEECGDIGCAVGTTIAVRELFYNTPARMKFLKKDVSEGNAVAAVVDRIALSAPHIAFKMIRDGKLTRNTPGDGKLSSAIYTVLGRELAQSVQPVEHELRGVRVVGYVSKPTACRANRNLQYTYINARLVRSKTIMAALEQAYKNSSMVGKFPACVLHIDLPAQEVDVNVHPAKTEVRFSDEKRIFDAVYYAVKNALQTNVQRPSMQLERKGHTSPADKPAQAVIGSFFDSLHAQDFAKMATQQTAAKGTEAAPVPTTATQTAPAQTVTPKTAAPIIDRTHTLSETLRFASSGSLYNAGGRRVDLDIAVDDTPPEKPTISRPPMQSPVVAQPERATDAADEDIIGEAPRVAEEAAPEPDTVEPPQHPPVRLIGEAFSTYILVEQGDELVLLDQHAAHERIIFEELKANEKPRGQLLLTPVSVPLTAEEYDAVLENIDLLNASGYEVEDFGTTVLVRAVPVYLDGEDPVELIRETAGGFLEHRRTASTAKLDWLYHSVACRAAVKAGNRLSGAEMQALAERVLCADDIQFCPHGRPVAIRLSKKEIEKQFGRLGSI